MDDPTDLTFHGDSEEQPLNAGIRPTLETESTSTRSRKAFTREPAATRSRRRRADDPATAAPPWVGQVILLVCFVGAAGFILSKTDLVRKMFTTGTGRR
jgi:hypothetical protein